MIGWSGPSAKLSDSSTISRAPPHYFRERTALSAEVGVAVNLVGLTDVLYHAQEMALAAQVLSTAAPQRWHVWAASGRAAYDHSVTAIRTQLDQAAFAMAWEVGRTRAIEQALAEALVNATQPRIG